MPSVRARSCGRVVGVGRTDAVAGAALLVAQLDLGRVDGHAGQRLEAVEETLDGRAQLVDGDATAMPTTRAALPASRAPTSIPACVPPVADGSTIAAGSTPALAGLADRLHPASTWPAAPIGPLPPIPTTYGRLPAVRRSRGDLLHERLAIRPLVGGGDVDGGAQQRVEALVRRRARRGADR